MKLFDSTFDSLNKALDLRFRRHSVLSGNVANSETPNYRARELDFAGEIEKVLSRDDKAKAIKKTNPAHMDVSSAEGAHSIYDNSMTMGADGNNVDLDVAMGKLSSNGRAYSGAAELLAMKLRLLRQATQLRGGA